MSGRSRFEVPLLLAALVALAALPFLAEAADNPYLMSTVARILIFAIAAISLDLLVGYGGMVSFGHAAYFGVGAYVVGILSFHAYDGTTVFGFPGSVQALVVWPLAIAASAAAALVIGALCLRAGGVYFIMITLAFAQMLFFLFVSLQQYGGDDGLYMFAGRSELPGLDLGDDMTFYYVCLAALVAAYIAIRTVVASRFGRVLRGIRQNERRMRTLGYPVYRYKLLAFVIAGAVAGLAGALIANQSRFVSPDLLHWTRSGDMLIMVILGGMGTLLGPVAGAGAFLLLEEYLPFAFEAVGLGVLRDHWRIVFGPLLIVVVLFARHGLYGLLFGRPRE